jgi:hypothetical protein
MRGGERERCRISGRDWSCDNKGSTRFGEIRGLRSTRPMVSEGETSCVRARLRLRPFTRRSSAAPQCRNCELRRVKSPGHSHGRGGTRGCCYSWSAMLVLCGRLALHRRHFPDLKPNEGPGGSDA